MTFYKPNQEYNTTLTGDYTVSDTTLAVTVVPSNVPTIVTVARGTPKETRFTVTGTGVGQLTGVARLDGANDNIPAGSSVECMNDVDFITQLASAVFDQSGLKGLVYAADGGSTDAYAITLPVAPSAYTDLTGIPLAFKANTANTGAATLAVNGMTGGPKNIKKFGSSGIQDLNDNDIQASQVVVVVFDGTQFILLGAQGIITGANIINPTISTTSNGNLEINPNGSGVIKAKTTVQLTVFGPTSDQSTGDGKTGLRIPKELDGFNLVGVAGCVTTAGTTGTCDIQVRRVRSGTPQDMLSTKLTIDSGELDSSTAATAAAINASYDDVLETDQLYIDVDAKHTTAAKGLFVHLTFAKP